MNGAHLHLVLNHIPVTGIIFSFFLLLFGTIKKNTSIINAGLIFTIIMSIFSTGAYLSGDEAEHVISKLIGINQDAIEDHQQIAVISLWVILINGIVASISLFSWFKSGKISKYLLWINIIMLFTGSILITKTGLTGGLIRHTERI